MPQDREPVRVAASRLDRDLDIVGIPSGRMEHGRVDPTLAHLLQAILGAVAGDLPVLPGRRALRPDMDLRVDDQHGGPPSRFRSGPVMLRDVGRLRIVTRAAAPRAGRAQPRRMFWGTDITRMPCSWRQCVTMFTEELPWLKGRDLDLVMGRAVCDWIGWKLPE